MVSTPKKPKARARPPRVAVVVSAYNASITGPLRDGALAAFAERFGSREVPVVAEAPGAFELPALANAAAASKKFDAVVCLGCIIKGETSHDQFIAQAVANGVCEITLRTGVPVAFGVLTVNTIEQARERAGGAHGNKGREAMLAAIEALGACNALRKGRGHQLACVPHDKAESCP